MRHAVFLVLASLTLGACGQTAQLVAACQTPYCEADEPGWAPQAPAGMRHIPFSVSHNEDVESVRVHGDTVVVRTKTEAYCGGTPPPPPRPFLLEVPDAVQHVEHKARHRGRCKGPPRP